jgi:hypothetical protein
MRRNLGWFSIIIPTLSSMIVSTFKPFGMSGRLSNPGTLLMFGILVLSFAAGFGALLLTPFRSSALKWVCVPAYVVLIPLAMFAIDVAIDGFNIFQF